MPVLAAIRFAILLAIVSITGKDALAQDAAAFVEYRIGVLLDREFEHKMISSGQNFPAVNLRREHRANIAVLLHEGIPLSEIKQYFAWTDADLAVRLDELVEAGLVRRTADDQYRPTLMVMTLGDVARHLPVPGQMVSDAARLVVRRLAEIRRSYSEIPGFSGIPFESASFLILSDVLLDNWQINTVERRFLHAERPLRADKRYYYSLQEKAPWDSTEAFGIYGNQYRGYGPVTVGVYGNRRQGNAKNLNSLDRDAVERLFGVSPDTVKAFKRDLVAQVVRAFRDTSYAVPAQLRSGLASLGWVRDGRVIIPVLSDSDDEALSEMADLVADEYLALLERYRRMLTEFYEKSPYAREVTFEEYFMWWYHLFYTAVTDQLTAEGHITVPDSGITTYLIVSTG